MNKRYLHHVWTKLRPISCWYFLAMAIGSGFIFLYAYRQNNVEMIQLRDEVFRADKQNGDVEGALKRLRQHVYAHMNTDLASGKNAVRPPIQLKYRYERLVTAEKQRTAAGNTNIYTAAQADCERRFPKGLSGSGRIPCIQEYVTQRSVKEQPIPDALYKFDFVSPRWSPDLAGWSLLASLGFLGVFIARFALERWLKSELSS